MSAWCAAGYMVSPTGWEPEMQNRDLAADYVRRS
jgi:hypothetical protein